jgi:hypothetical protein
MKNKISSFVFQVMTAGLIGICLLGSHASSAGAADLSTSFDVYSPETVQHLSYSNPEFPFTILAPKGWYMVMLKVGAPVDTFKVLFFKNDPRPALSQGEFSKPYIRVDLAQNKDITTAKDYGAQVVTTLKTHGVTFFSEPQDLTIDGQTGINFTTDSPVERDATIDNYIFVNKKMILLIGILAPTVGYPEVKAEILEAVNSLKFVEKK